MTIIRVRIMKKKKKRKKKKTTRMIELSELTMRKMKMKKTVHRFPIAKMRMKLTTMMTVRTHPMTMEMIVA
jgi:hypothetical protein